MPSRPTWFRFTVSAKPSENAKHRWEQRSVDAVVEFSTLSLLSKNLQVGGGWIPVSYKTENNETPFPHTDTVYVPTPIAGIRTSSQE
jgi:hypothetical protein